MIDEQPRDEALWFRRLCAQSAEEILAYVQSSDGFTSFSHEPPGMSGAEMELARLRRKCRGVPAAFIGRDTALSAGCDPQPSLSYVLPVPVEISSAAPGRFFRCGTPPEVLVQSVRANPKKRDVSFLQIILLNPDAAGTAMDTLLARRSLTGLLPGYMARSLGIKTSVKLHRELVRCGFAGGILETMIQEAYAALAGEGITVITGFDCDPVIAALTPIIQQVEKALIALFQKRVSRGYAECGLDRDCGSCEENIVCASVIRFSREKNRRV